MKIHLKAASELREILSKPRYTEAAIKLSDGRTGTPLTASVGDTVLRVSREKNLPNIAGKADIFGRTAEGLRAI
jgi:hypothetical protein